MYRSLLQRDNQYYINFDKQEIIEEPGYLELTHHQINRRVAFVNLGVLMEAENGLVVLNLLKNYI